LRMELNELNVIRFLESIGIKRTIKGYCYLKRGILLCMDEPTLTCQQICEGIILSKNDKSNYKSVYRACSYAIKQAEHEEYKKMAPSAFFKEVSTLIHNKNLERSVGDSLALKSV